MRVLVQGVTGRRVVDAAIPPGTFDVAGKVGWTTAGGGTLRYEERNGVLQAPGGIVSASIRITPAGELRLKLKGRQGDYAVLPADLPLAVTVVLDMPRAETGKCVVATYGGSPPGCVFSAAGSTLRCKYRNQ